MKKTLFMLICLALVIACVAPVAAFAEGSSAVASERDSIHFIDPTAITVVGDKLYVADNIEDGKCAVICFDAGASNPEPLFTYELDMAISGLSNNGSDIVYAFGKSAVLELTTQDDETLAISQTYDKFPEGITLVDFTYGNVVLSSENKTMYALTETGALQYLNGEFQAFANITNIAKTAGMLSARSGNVSYLYYLHDDTCDRYNLSINGHDSDFAQNLQLTSGFTPTGIFALASKIALYNNTEIYVIEESTRHVDTVAELSLSELYGADCSIVDVIAYGNRLFVLNSKNQIDIFDKVDSYDTTNYATIGSDMVDKAVPTSYTSFTLARPVGYPANIVFKTNNEQTSIEKIYTEVEEYNEYIILGYNGDESSHYYYVMIGDKFGWVKKSNGSATTPVNDSKLSVVNNNIGDETFGYETKFTSLNGVFVYELPLSTATQTEVTQTATTMKTVKVLQSFEEGEQTWYYVTYDEGKTGFVKKEDVGQFHITSKVEQIETLGLKKINSSLFSAVSLYASAELGDGETVVNEQGNSVKLYSGDRVTLVKTEGDSSFIMILHDDGTKDFGWVESGRLIDIHKITTNAIVGLSLLGFAIVLGLVLVIVYVKRKKRIKANRD